jgi:hypothetical protein
VLDAIADRGPLDGRRSGARPGSPGEEQHARHRGGTRHDPVTAPVGPPESTTRKEVTMSMASAFRRAVAVVAVAVLAAPALADAADPPRFRAY